MTEDVLVIRATAGWRAINARELWRFRELLWQLTWRDIQVRYKQTVLGIAWAVIQPVMTMIVFTIFFGKLGGMARFAPDHIPYPVFVYAALLPWQFFAFSMSHGGNSLIHSERMISKIYFPRLLLPLGVIGTGLVDFLVSLSVLAALMWHYEVVLSWNVLLTPVLAAGMILAAAGMSTLLASLSAVYRDFRYVIPFTAQIWMFASPVAYPLDRVPEEWRLLYSVNPMAGIIEGYRSALLGLPIQAQPLLVSLASAAGIALFGLFYFRRVERRFADII